MGDGGGGGDGGGERKKELGKYWNHTMAMFSTEEKETKEEHLQNALLPADVTQPGNGMLQASPTLPPQRCVDMITFSLRPEVRTISTN
jgi:hypothetical protein